ncbi:MAG TPA: hypothetical protein DET40_04900 [Lentisphaeria bacterium]|nr:MAG: hypothetical protein A2X45_13475 [Lentisphaerae bacterium GWF2_50_93]HCE42864.1 hypothetical protein [Lentisphaeria bacterium]
MAVLDKSILGKHGPYIDFIDRKEPMFVAEGDWPNKNTYSKEVFFELADDLLDLLCTFTKSYTSINPHEVTQYKKYHEIMGLSSDFLLWAHYVARSPDMHFNNYLRIYKGSARFSDGEKPSTEILQQDLLDTMLFLSDRLNKIAFSKRCLVIVGI